MMALKSWIIIQAGPLISKPLPLISGNSQSSLPHGLSTSRSYTHTLCSCVTPVPVSFLCSCLTLSSLAVFTKNILMLMTSWVWVTLAQLIPSFLRLHLLFQVPFLSRFLYSCHSLYVPIKGFHLQEIHGKDSDKYRFLVTDCTAELNE